MHSIAPSPCAFIRWRARSRRYLRRRSQLTRCCQSNPTMPKFAIVLPPSCGERVTRQPSKFNRPAMSFRGANDEECCQQHVRSRQQQIPRCARDETHPQSMVAPDSLATLPQRAPSALTNDAKSSGVLLVTTVTPPAAKRCLTSGESMVVTNAACSFSTIGRGVPAGTNTPCQELLTISG